MLEMTLFMSSARDHEGNPLIKAILTGGWDPSDAERVKDWLDDGQKHILVIADDKEFQVRWVG